MPRRKKSKASLAEPEPDANSGTNSAEAQPLSLPEGEAREERVEPSAKPDATPNIMNNLDALNARITEVAEEVARLSQKLGSLQGRLDVLEDVEEELEEEEEEERPPKAPLYNEYVVQEDETLTQIAKKLLGNPGRFNEIAALNYDRYPSLRGNVNDVKEGWVLRLP